MAIPQTTVADSATGAGFRLRRFDATLPVWIGAALFVVVLMLLAWIGRVAKTLLKRHETVFAMALASLAGVLGGMVGINGDNISTSVGWTQGTMWILLGVGAAAFQVALTRQPASPQK